MVLKPSTFWATVIKANQQCSNRQSGAYCQTLSHDNNEAYRCYESRWGSASAGKTLSVLNLSELLQAYPSMTISMATTTQKSLSVLSYVDVYATRTPSPTVTSPSGYLNLIKSGPPSCVNTLNATCAGLYAASQKCWSEAYPPGPEGCFCQALASNSCTSFCTANVEERNGYYQWVMGLCSTTNDTFITGWPEYKNRTQALYEDLIPWSWRIQADHQANSGAVCPSTTAKIASFALVNLLVGISTLFLGRRTVVHKMTFGMCGHPGSQMWVLIAFMVVGLNILANFINALLIKRATGFSAVPIWTLVIFWMCRPRLAWLATALVKVEVKKHMYTSLGASAMLVEFILQGVGAVYLGQTVVFASKRKFYIRNKLQYAPAHKSALYMYSGALVWIVAIGFFYLYVLYNYLGVKQVLFMVFSVIWKGLTAAGRGVAKVIPKRKKQHAEQTDSETATHIDGGRPKAFSDTAPPAYSEAPPTGELRGGGGNEEPDWIASLNKMGLDTRVLSNISIVFVFMLLPFVGQWLFWIGFVGLFAERYCPPEVWTLAGVWTVFSAVGELYRGVMGLWNGWLIVHRCVSWGVAVGFGRGGRAVLSGEHWCLSNGLLCPI